MAVASYSEKTSGDTYVDFSSSTGYVSGSNYPTMSPTSEFDGVASGSGYEDDDFLVVPIGSGQDQLGPGSTLSLTVDGVPATKSVEVDYGFYSAQDLKQYGPLGSSTLLTASGSSASGTISVPANQPAGSYLAIQLDAYGANTGYTYTVRLSASGASGGGGTVTPPSGAAAFVPKIVSVDDSSVMPTVTAGEHLTIQGTVTNTGSVAGHPGNAVFRIWKDDETFATSTLPVTASVAAGETYDEGSGIDVPGTLAPNTKYYVQMIVDGVTSNAFIIKTASSGFTPPVLSVAVDPSTAGFVNGQTPILTGTIADNTGAAGVEIYDGAADLGAATVNGDGTWTFSGNVGTGDHADLTAVATDAQGLTASAAAPYELVTGVRGEPYRAIEYDDTADGSYGYTEFGRQGEDLASGMDNGDGTHTMEAYVDGQVLTSIHDDRMTGDGSAERYVFDPGFSHDEVTDLNLEGPGHDVIDLTGTHMTSLAEVLRHTTMGDGSATIHLNPQDTITLDGVTRAQIKANPGDFAFA